MCGEKIHLFDKSCSLGFSHFGGDGRARWENDLLCWGALTVASLKGHLQVVRALLSAKADVNAKAANGETAMSLATKGGFSQILQLLKASL